MVQMLMFRVIKKRTGVHQSCMQSGTVTGVKGDAANMCHLQWPEINFHAVFSKITAGAFLTSLED